VAPEGGLGGEGETKKKAEQHETAQSERIPDSKLVM